MCGRRSPPRLAEFRSPYHSRITRGATAAVNHHHHTHHTTHTAPICISALHLCGNGIALPPAGMGGHEKWMGAPPASLLAHLAPQNPRPTPPRHTPHATTTHHHHHRRTQSTPCKSTPPPRKSTPPPPPPRRKALRPHRRISPNSTASERGPNHKPHVPTTPHASPQTHHARPPSPPCSTHAGQAGTPPRPLHSTPAAPSMPRISNSEVRCPQPDEPRLPTHTPSTSRRELTPSPPTQSEQGHPHAELTSPAPSSSSPPSSSRHHPLRPPLPPPRPHPPTTSPASSSASSYASSHHIPRPHPPHHPPLPPMLPPPRHIHAHSSSPMDTLPPPRPSHATPRHAAARGNIVVLLVVYRSEKPSSAFLLV